MSSSREVCSGSLARAFNLGPQLPETLGEEGVVRHSCSAHSRCATAELTRCTDAPVAARTMDAATASSPSRPTACAATSSPSAKHCCVSLATAGCCTRRPFSTAAAALASTLTPRALRRPMSAQQSRASASSATSSAATCSRSRPALYARASWATPRPHPPPRCLRPRAPSSFSLATASRASSRCCTASGRAAGCGS